MLGTSVSDRNTLHAIRAISSGIKYAVQPKPLNRTAAIFAPTTPTQFRVDASPAPVETNERSSGLLVTSDRNTRTAKTPTITATTSFSLEFLAALPFFFLSKVVPSARQKLMSSSL
jgi:hypothetical protein